MSTITKDKLNHYKTRAYFEKTASRSLNEAATPYNKARRFDIFLSHSFSDKEDVKALVNMLTSYNYTVYVDWLVDPHLDRTNVNSDNAALIKDRMKQCKSLVYAFSENATQSKWMPWELGYFDGFKGKVSLLPITESEKTNFKGTEYLSLYPWLDVAPKLTFSSDEFLRLNSRSNESERFSNWL